jgi:predicted RNase H-like nuclease (RuvC/YqgF family)
MTTQEEKIRVNARIPKSLYDWLNSKYDNVSQAINEGLEILKESKTSELSYNRKDVIQDSHTNPESVIQEHINVIQPVIQDDIHTLKTLTEDQKEMIEDYKVQVQALNSEISRLKNTIMEAPDPVDLVRFQERNDGLNLVIEEKNRSIDRLEKEVNRLDMFSNYFKSNQVKQIEAPATEKKKRWYEFWK